MPMLTTLNINPIQYEKHYSDILANTGYTVKAESLKIL